MNMMRSFYESPPQVKSQDNDKIKTTDEAVRPMYALEHLVTFKIKNETEIRNPREKLKALFELDKIGNIWPQKMYMCFNGHWLVMLDRDMIEIENFPGSLIYEPTAFISDESLESFNNILMFTVPGSSLGNTEMHIFQVTDVSAVHLVEDLNLLNSGKIVRVDRNKQPIQLRDLRRTFLKGKDHYGLVAAAAGVAAEHNFQDRSQTNRDIMLLNHCFEDIERFVARLQYAAETLQELEARQRQRHSGLHGEGLLILRSHPPMESEFIDILSKQKLALNYIVKLKDFFADSQEPAHNLFTSLRTVVNVCNDIHTGSNVPENVVNPLLRRETVTFLSSILNKNEIEFWNRLGPNWTLPRDQFNDHNDSFYPIFYDDWSPDWVVGETVSYSPLMNKTDASSESSSDVDHKTWRYRLQSRKAKIALVNFSKEATNDKEIQVAKGEYLEIIDDSRKWWKARKSNGQIGYVPHTILTSNNFEPFNFYIARDADTLSLSIQIGSEKSSTETRHVLSTFVAAPEDGNCQQDSSNATKANMPRSISLPNVPIPPPMPPSLTSESHSCSLIATSVRNPSNDASSITEGSKELPSHNDEINCSSDSAFVRQSEINEELRLALLQRQKRRDLEILTTPQIYINQYSTAVEVEEWLRGKGFSDNIINKLRDLNGEELFALSPHIIESYFGQKNSRRLISQIILQKNICEYKTLRSSELSAKLARARQKLDEEKSTQDEMF